jgi:nitrite reductase/ring-hydroxylating ferredoxin subunit
MEEGQFPNRQQAARGWSRYEEADLGFRNYWYPVLEARKVGDKPVPVMVCGENLVLIRDKGKVHALHDRCPHRGVPLSAGRKEFPGTITCCYHGWTFDPRSGALVAALTDGPNSPICGKPEVQVRTFPVEERASLIWVYIGDEPRPPVEVDIPEPLLAADAIVEPQVDVRDGDWRYAMENAVDEAHAKYFHRYTPYFIFYKIPGFQTDVRMVPSPDGKWLQRQSKPVFEQADYPGVGKWPRKDFWRFKGGKGQIVVCAARLPATFLVDHGDWQDYQMFVPVDRARHLTLQVSMKRTRGFGMLKWKLRYWVYIRYIHHHLLNRREDGFIVSKMSCPPEQLFRPDISIVGWRHWCHKHARRAPTDAELPSTEKQFEISPGAAAPLRPMPAE